MVAKKTFHQQFHQPWPLVEQTYRDGPDRRGSMADAEAHVLVRQKAAVLDTALRFAGKPCAAHNGSTRLAMEKWRDAHNRQLSAALLKSEGKVVCLVLTEQLMVEYTAFRARFPASEWRPLSPPAGLRELSLVSADADAAVASAAGGEDVEAASAADADEDDDDDGMYVRPLPGSEPGGYVRQPALHGRQLALVAEGDIWLAQLDAVPQSPSSSSGVVCARLTTQGNCSHPRFSPDGTLLAYTAGPADRSSDATEVYVVDSRGRGRMPTRLTHLGDRCEVAGWTADGAHVVFRTSAGAPMRHLVELWAAPIDGHARPSPLSIGISHHLLSLPCGATVRADVASGMSDFVPPLPAILPPLPAILPPLPAILPPLPAILPPVRLPGSHPNLSDRTVPSPQGRRVRHRPIHRRSDARAVEGVPRWRDGASVAWPPWRRVYTRATASHLEHWRTVHPRRPTLLRLRPRGRPQYILNPHSTHSRGTSRNRRRVRVRVRVRRRRNGIRCPCRAFRRRLRRRPNRRLSRPSQRRACRRLLHRRRRRRRRRRSCVWLRDRAYVPQRVRRTRPDGGCSWQRDARLSGRRERCARTQELLSSIVHCAWSIPPLLYTAAALYRRCSIPPLSAEAPACVMLVHPQVGGELRFLPLDPPRDHPPELAPGGRVEREVAEREAAVREVAERVAPMPVPVCKVGVLSAAAEGTWDAECLDSLDGFALHPDGHSLLLGVRGRLFALAGLWEGPASQVGERDGVRYSCAAFSYNGRPVAAACDASGEWSIVIFPSDPTEPATKSSHSSRSSSSASAAAAAAAGSRPARTLRLRGPANELGEPYEMVPSPEASLLAVATHDLRLLLIDTSSGVSVRLDAAEHDGGCGATAARPDHPESLCVHPTTPGLSLAPAPILSALGSRWRPLPAAILPHSPLPRSHPKAVRFESCLPAASSI